MGYFQVPLDDAASGSCESGHQAPENRLGLGDKRLVQDMRVLIYDRYLSTAGGGERYVGKMAEVLSQSHDVSILSDLEFDLGVIKERLGIDLSRVNVMRFPGFGRYYAKRLLREFDVFFNATYMSFLPGFARRNVYVVFFPAEFGTDMRPDKRLLLALFSKPLRAMHAFLGMVDPDPSGSFEPIRGVYDVRAFFAGRTSWSSGDVALRISCAGDNSTQPKVLLVGPKEKGVESFEVRIFLDGQDVGRLSVRNGQVVALESLSEGHHLLEIKSDYFRPCDVSASADNRRIGVGLKCRPPAAARGPSCRSVFVSERLFSRLLQLSRRILSYVPEVFVNAPDMREFVSSYDGFISISNYVSSWVSKRWGVQSFVLYPPVDVRAFQPSFSKRDEIASVGRFFKGHHNKKQLELVRAFKKMVDKGLNGWKLVLMGGVDERRENLEYLDRVRREASGYPVEVLPNISREELVHRLASCKIYWHAAGLGEREDLHPEKSEHFGVSTVEAMAAGCVPVVLDRGGQREIVVQGQSGFLVNDEDELIGRTLLLADDEMLLKRMSAEAVRRAEYFGEKRFEKELEHFMEEIVAGLEKRCG